MNALDPNSLITHQIPVIAKCRGSSDSDIAKTVSKRRQKTHARAGVDEVRKGADEGPSDEDDGAPQVHEMGGGRFCPRWGGRCKPWRGDPEGLRVGKERRAEGPRSGQGLQTMSSRPFSGGRLVRLCVTSRAR